MVVDGKLAVWKRRERAYLDVAASSSSWAGLMDDQWERLYDIWEQHGN